MFHRYIAASTCILAICFAQAASAGTIIRLSLDDPTPNLEFDGTILGTVAGGVITAGDQDTTIEFTDVLSFLSDTSGSFTLSGLTADGNANEIGPIVIQNFVGGMFELYESPSNDLILSGTLFDSVLTGTSGSPGTAAVFTTSVGSFTGGTLQPLLIDDSLTLSMSLDEVRTAGARGLTVVNGDLEPFTANASVLIGGEIPEPTSALLAMIGAVMIVATAVRRRRR